MRKPSILFILLLMSLCSFAQKQTVVVDQQGKGNYKSIQAAINSLPDSSATLRRILIKNGTYREKIYIEKNNILLEGESRDKTIVTQAIARDAWRCGHADDWGVATINVGANDISFKNLTVANTFGFDWKAPVVILCKSDTVSGKKTLSKDGHQMALRTMNSTRLRAVNCRFTSFGGDTVSPWDVENGLWYFKDCIMEGGVDFYCPRGWAWAENCEFIAHSGPAAIWHDGSAVEDSKTVLKNCVFKGFDGFMLGRYHRDAQFFLIGCRFAKNMADKPIYRVPTNNTIRWGQRIYYYNCRREDGADFSWYKNNLPPAVSPSEITVNWVFGNRWNPENF